MSPLENSINNNYSNNGAAWEIRFTSIDITRSPYQLAPPLKLRANVRIQVTELLAGQRL